MANDTRKLIEAARRLRSQARELKNCLVDNMQWNAELREFVAETLHRCYQRLENPNEAPWRPSRK